MEIKDIMLPLAREWLIQDDISCEVHDPDIVAGPHRVIGGRNSIFYNPTGIVGHHMISSSRSESPQWGG